MSSGCLDISASEYEPLVCASQTGEVADRNTERSYSVLCSDDGDLASVSTEDVNRRVPTRNRHKTSNAYFVALSAMQRPGKSKLRSPLRPDWRTLTGVPLPNH